MVTPENHVEGAAFRPDIKASAMARGLLRPSAHASQVHEVVLELLLLRVIDVDSSRHAIRAGSWSEAK